MNLPYFKNFIKDIFWIIILVITGFLNWILGKDLLYSPKHIYRLLWLGAFFVIADLFIEIMIRAGVKAKILMEIMNLDHKLKKLSSDFKIFKMLKLPDGLTIEYVLMGTKGIWIITIKDKGGKVSFDGENIIQGSTIYKGIISESAAKSYALSNFIKSKLNIDIQVNSAIVFSSFGTDISGVPELLRGVTIAKADKILEIIKSKNIEDKSDPLIIEKIIKLFK